MAHGAFKVLDSYKIISADSHIVEPPDMYTEPDRARNCATARRGWSGARRRPGREYDAWMLDGQAGRHLGRGDAGRAALRGPVADRFPRRLGGRPQGRLRRRCDDRRERRGRDLGLGAAAEPGAVLVPRPGQRAALRDLPRLQRLDRRFLQALSRPAEGHRDAQCRRSRRGRRRSSSAAPRWASSARSSRSRRSRTSRTATRSTTVSGRRRRTRSIRCCCISARRATAFPANEFTMDLDRADRRRPLDHRLLGALFARLDAVRRRVRQVPRSEDRLGRARGGVDPALAEADGLHLSSSGRSSPRAGGRRRGCCRATTGSATCSSSSWRTISACNCATRSASRTCCGAATTRMPRRPSRARSNSSAACSPACPRPICARSPRRTPRKMFGFKLD